MDPEKTYHPPPYSADPEQYVRARGRTREPRGRIPRLPRRSRGLRVLGLACLTFVAYAQWRQLSPTPGPSGPDMTAHGLSVKRLREDLATCARLHTTPTEPGGIGRERSARYVDGHRPTLIRNATVWVGEPAEGTTREEARAGRGYAWITADVLLQHGLVRRVGRDMAPHDVPGDARTYDAAGRPLTSGIIDMHSHAGVHSLPTLRAADDVIELSSDLTPYARALDGLQPADRQLQVAKSGGVTSSLILPGSSNNVGGEGFVVKHAVGRADGRNETSVADMLADPDHRGGPGGGGGGLAWRHVKMACGENPKRAHGRPGGGGPTSRLGESWAFRHAFERAAALVRAQDDWCAAAAAAGGLDRARAYLPVELRWEALVAVLRGQAHVHVHCYTIPDLEAFVGHSNEFGFRVRAFHHAHQSYLVPDILKRAWGDDPPASALFADNMWYKAEAYVGSEHAGKHLHDSGLVPIYVSDNPVLNAQHLVFEAAKAYRYGLPYHAALASVTTAPAERLGLGQRLGKVKAGYDADVVVWDSDPLSVGATPVQVWIDGTAQYEDPAELRKPSAATIVPDGHLANLTREDPVAVGGDIVFTGVSKVLLALSNGTADPDSPANDDDDADAEAGTTNVAVSHGRITCVGRCAAQLDRAAASDGVRRLRNGHLAPAFAAFGSTLGLNAVDSEADTDNGADGDVFSRAADGLALGTRKLRAARRYGVTRALSAPRFAAAGSAGHHGTSAGFRTGAAHAAEPGAVFAPDAALHYTLDLSAKRGDTPSLSAAVGALRRRLLGAVAAASASASPRSDEGVIGGQGEGEDAYSEAAFLRKVVAGELPLAVTVHSADTIAAVLAAKADVEAAAAGNASRPLIRLVIVGGAEAHLVAGPLAAADVAVVLAPIRGPATSWDRRRALPGAPLTDGTTLDALLDAGVAVALAPDEDWEVRDLGLLAGVAHANGGGRLGEREALDLAGANLFRILGLDEPAGEDNFVLHEDGSPLEIGSRVRAVGDGTGSVYVF